MMGLQKKRTTPEEFAAALSERLSGKLKSVLLYGSAVAGDFVPGTSTYNLLVVVERLGLNELDGMSGAVSEWMKEGNAAPMLFTPEELAETADAFPIELADIRQSRRVLSGADPFSEMVFHHDSLRLQLERELKGKLLALRGHYIGGGSYSEALCELMADSLSTFLVLFRAGLRLYQSEIPVIKLEALAALAGHIPLEMEPFQEVSALKINHRRLKSDEARGLFGRYLAAIEAIVKAIDQKICQSGDSPHV